MFQAKIDCWWLNFIIFSRQEADVTVFWDMFQVKLAMGQFPGRRSFIVQFPGKVGDGSPLPHFPGRRSFIVQLPGKIGDGSPLQHFPGRRGKSRAAEACRWQRRLVQPAAGGL